MSCRISVIAASLAASVLVLAGACGKKGSSSSPPSWTKRPLERRTETKRNVTFSLLLPKGIGAFNDPNGNIWRDVTSKLQLFIKVFVKEYPPDLKSAREGMILQQKEVIVEEKALPDGYRIVTEMKGVGVRRFLVIKRAGKAAVECFSFYQMQEYDAKKVKTWNDWLVKLCDSLEVAGQKRNE